MPDPVAPKPKSLDYDAVCMRDAAARLGIATETRLVEPPDGFPAGRRPWPWLVIQLDTATWYFRRGVLCREGEVPGRPGEHINGPARAVMGDKAAAKRALADAGLPVARGRLFAPAEIHAAMAYAVNAGRTQCVKPNRGTRGILVFPDCRSVAEVARAFERVTTRYDEVLVEDSIPGEVVRYFYVAPRAFAAKLSRPASVVGDGEHTIEELIAEKNRERERRRLAGHYPVEVDGELRSTLAAGGRSLSCVPARGERVGLRMNTNAHAGADTVECLDLVHPSYARSVEAACRAIPGLRLSAVEVIVFDKRVPATSDNHCFIELNHSPSFVQFHYPWEGRVQDVGGTILRHLVENPS